MIPGVPGGIQWRVAFSTPRIDLFKQTAQLPPQLALGPGQFSLRTAVQLCLNCAHRRDDRPGVRRLEAARARRPA